MSTTNASARDPYTVLGLDRSATPIQIKISYHKLALKYHPDRQLHQSQQQSGDDSADASNDRHKSATDKFAEISSAYALLSDPVRKQQYDHLYKYGAFDYDESSANNTNTGYRYTENYSGGYYTNKADKTASSTSTTVPPPSFYRSHSDFSQDSFFDDMIYSPTSRSQKGKTFDTHTATRNTPASANTNNNQKQNSSTDTAKRKPGIGFAFAPLGKHLSIHVPSRNEIISSIARGERLHNFGTRVTFSSQKVDRGGNNKSNVLCPGIGSTLHESTKAIGSDRTFVSTTTRIANGQHRVVKQTAILHADGKKEVVVEENGVVRRRYVEEFAKDERTGASDAQQEPHETDGEFISSPHNTDTMQEEGKENGRPWYSEVLKNVQGVFRPCLAPCGPVLVSVPEKDAL
jgi:curved DNA-binding protein CbpA